MKKLALILSLLALGAFGFAACGDDEDEPSNGTEAATEETTEEEPATGDGAAGGGGTVAISADPGGALEYEQDEVSTSAGSVTIEFANEASLPHDVVVEDDQGSELARTDTITGDTATTTAEFEPGDYTFYCSVDGHREAGMEGAFVVE